MRREGGWGEMGWEVEGEREGRGDEVRKEDERGTTVCSIKEMT